jgi:hypothetical protein
MSSTISSPPISFTASHAVSVARFILKKLEDFYEPGFWNHPCLEVTIAAKT